MIRPTAGKHVGCGAALMLALSLSACTPVVQPGQSPSATKIDPGPGILEVDHFPGPTDRDRINQALAKASLMEGPKVIRFTRRDYRITPLRPDSFEPVLGGRGLSDLILEGRGAVLVAQDALDCQMGYFFKLSSFSNLVVRDLTLCYRPTPFVQGTIVSTDQANNRTTIRLDPRFAHIEQILQTPHSELWCRVGLQEAPHLPKADNPSWMNVGIESNGAIRMAVNPDESVTVAAGWIDMEWALHAHYNWAPGDPFVIWKRSGQDGFCFEAGKQLVLQNIRVESALHFAIKLLGIENATLSRCAVIPASGAMLSGCADGLDIQQSRDIVIEDCTLVSTGDDAISFLNHGHGFNGQTYEKKFPPPYPETNERVLIRRNHIEGGNRNGILLLAFEADVIGNNLSHIRQYGLKFSGNDTRIEGNFFRSVGTFSAYRHIPDELNTGIICSDEWDQFRATIRNNRLEDWSNMPGILLKSLHNARVTGNTFVLRDTSTLDAKPHNPYLDSPKAIVVTDGNFEYKPRYNSDISIQANRFLAGSTWSRVEDAFFLHGNHARVTFRNNEMFKP
jgi:hypothetical protein